MTSHYRRQAARAPLFARLGQQRSARAGDRVPGGLLRSYEAQFRAAVAEAFGGARFTLRDLWRERPGEHAWPSLWRLYPETLLPEPSWEDLMRRELGRLQGIDPAPGPGGGEGWRVAPAVLEQIACGREDAAAARTVRNTSCRAAAAALSSRFAALTLDDAAQQVRAVYPDLELAPSRERGSLRPVSIGTVVLEWSRLHGCGGVTVDGNSSVIACEWQHAGRLAQVLAQLDAVIDQHVEATARHHEALLAALAPYRGDTATPGGCVRPLQGARSDRR